MCKALVATIAACALAIGGVYASASAQLTGDVALTDLEPTSAQPTDGASAKLDFVEFSGNTVVTVAVSGLDVIHLAPRTILGAHFHVGPCVQGDFSSAGARYNSTGSSASASSPATEVWLSLPVEGNASSTTATLPFLIAPLDANSLVIYGSPTMADGSTGPAWGCIDIPWLSAPELRERTFDGASSIAIGTPPLAHTGSGLTEILAVIGTTLVVSGAMLVRATTPRSRVRRLHDRRKVS